jgi:small nuclear ribonucleoprotein (snRNP)-like protein
VKVTLYYIVIYITLLYGRFKMDKLNKFFLNYTNSYDDWNLIESLFELSELNSDNTEKSWILKKSFNNSVEQNLLISSSKPYQEIAISMNDRKIKEIKYFSNQFYREIKNDETIIVEYDDEIEELENMSEEIQTIINSYDNYTNITIDHSTKEIYDNKNNIRNF